MKKVLSLVGARPQFVKEAVVGIEARRNKAWEHIVVHSGQHYDAALSDIFFDELSIPKPKYNLGIGSGTHAAMTAAALLGMENVLLAETPDALIVYGDTNTTLAGALAAAKMHIPVVHVEAGIRMLPKDMPEEINRVMTDSISSVCCCCSDVEVANLHKENSTASICVTGDVMYDIFLRMQPHFRPETLCSQYGVAAGNFVVATLHRDYNVDSEEALRDVIAGLCSIARAVPVLFFAHPRTQKRLQEYGISLEGTGVQVHSPVGYIEIMSLVAACSFVVTDSGGLQKEAYFAGKRAIVVMPDAGWRALVESGWNLLAPDSDAVSRAFASICDSNAAPAFPTIYRTKDAGIKIISAVQQYLNEGAL